MGKVFLHRIGPSVGMAAVLCAPACNPTSGPRAYSPPPKPIGSVPPLSLFSEHNWGFEGGLEGWTARGTAFDNQPTFGDNVKAERVLERTDMPLGGNYWRAVAYPIGHKGNYWVGSYENRRRFQDPRGGVHGDRPTGTLTSDPFVLKNSFITFLVGGGNNARTLKVELLERAEGGRIDEYEDGSYRATGLLDTGHDSELLRRAWWNVRAYRGRTLRIRVSDQSPTGHINVDDFRFQDSAPNAVGPNIPTPTVVRHEDHFIDKDRPVWGVADMHTHPLSHLAFGERIFSRDIDGDLATALSQCDCDHGNAVTECSSQANVFRNMLIQVMDGAEHGPPPPHPPPQFHFWGYHPNLVHHFSYWPAFNDKTHQEMWHGWLRRAYDGGLRVIIALAHHNQLLSTIGNGTPGHAVDDMYALRKQIGGMLALDEAHDFMRIVYSPDELRSAVRDNKLAVILGSELDNIGNFYRPVLTSNATVSVPYNANPTLEEMESALSQLWDMGIRYLFPIHLTNNAIGGAALYDDMFNVANRFYTGAWFSVEAHAGLKFRLSPLLTPTSATAGLEQTLGLGLIRALADIGLSTIGLPADFLETPTYNVAPREAGFRNSLGLTPGFGADAIEQMMRMGFMLDVDHMSEKAIERMLTIADAYTYPLNSGHNGFRALSRAPNENQRSNGQAQALAGLGGMMGVGWGCDDVKSFSRYGYHRLRLTSSRVANDAPGSSKSFAQSYLNAVEWYGPGVALGTDINSFVVDPAPRFGPHANYCAASDRLPSSSRQQDASTIVVYGTSWNDGHLAPPQVERKSWDYNHDGLAHYGLLPDFLQDLSNIGVNSNDLGHLMRSAESVARMWEATSRASQKASGD